MLTRHPIAARSALLAAFAAIALPTPAAAQDEDLELWLNPSISFDLDPDTGLEVETAQRFRDGSRGREDTYFGRLWLNQELAGNVTLSGAVERRINDPGRDETRTIQQLSTSHGILRTRLRLEQRFVDDRRMGLRLRPRLGVEVPIDRDGQLAFVADAELALTLRSTSAGGDTGLTGLRTQIGASYEVSDRVSVTLAYLRQQDIEEGAADRIGHAPIVGVELSF